MDTATTVVSDFTTFRYSDISTANALRLFNMIHKRILARLGIRDTTLDISLTDGTREYDLAETAMQIRAAYYVRSATDAYQLEELTIDGNDILDKGWRTDTTEQEPTSYYILTATNSNTSKKRIGFDPIPPTTTSTYPKVTLYITQHTDLIGSDTLPTSLQDSQIYLDGMSWLFAKARRLPSADHWKNEFEKRCQEEIAFINSVTRHEPTIYLPSWVRGRAVV